MIKKVHFWMTCVHNVEMCGIHMWRHYAHFWNIKVVTKRKDPKNKTMYIVKKENHDEKTI